MVKYKITNPRKRAVTAKGIEIGYNESIIVDFVVDDPKLIIEKIEAEKEEVKKKKKIKQKESE